MTIDATKAESFKHGMTRDTLEAAISADSTPMYKKAIFRAMRDYGVNFLHFQPRHPFFDTNILKSIPSAVVLVDDQANWPCGPKGFEVEALNHLTTGSDCIAVICDGSYPDIYTYISLMAGMHRCMTMVIETRPEYEQEWLRYAESMAPASFILRGSRLWRDREWL
jgi:hypothetical protein